MTVGRRRPAADDRGMNRELERSRVMSHDESIRKVYAAFLRGDVPQIQSLVADDVDWRNDGVESRECPWNGNFSGKANLPGFFKAVGEQLDITTFDVKAMAASGLFVAAFLRIESTLRKNGRSLRNDAVHFWTFNESGKIAKYRHFNDTAAELAAWRV
jgi:ketosteroid isomerase-like protein